MKNKIKRILTYTILLISSLLNHLYSQNKTLCERVKPIYLEFNDPIKNITLDSSNIIFYTNFHDRTCVFKLKDKISIYDTSFKSDFNLKFGMLIQPKTHFVTQNIGYRSTHIYNKGKLKPSDKYNFSSFFYTNNTGINWNKSVDLDSLDKENYHIIDDFFVVDSNVVILYGREIQFELKNWKSDRDHLKNKTTYDFKYYVETYRGLSIDTWNFNKIEYKNCMYITYDSGKNWIKIENLPKEVIDKNVFNYNENTNIKTFKNTHNYSEIVKFIKINNSKIKLINKIGKTYYLSI